MAGAVQGSSSASTRRRCGRKSDERGRRGKGKREKAWARREAGEGGGELVSGYG